MGRTTRKAEREQRRQEQRMASALALAAMGVAILLLPAVTSNAILRPMLANLRWPALLMLVAGLVLLVAARRGRARGSSMTEATSAPPRRPSRASQNEPVDHVEQASVTASLERRAREATEANASAVESNEGKPPSPPTAWGNEVFDVIEWRRFEAVCEWLFSQAGFETKTQSHGADGGIDIWLYSKNFGSDPVSVVQCKHWKSKPVKVGEVRALLGSMAHKKVSRGIFATTSTFTVDARHFAAGNKIQLLDRSGLLDLIARRTPEQQQELLAVATKGDYWVPTCASCGIKMVRRARKADSGGFWGCTNFPRCRTTING